jgi:hypothetical protein
MRQQTGAHTARLLRTFIWAAVLLTATLSPSQAHIGPLQLSVKEKETINVPVWASIGAIVAGGLVLLGGSRKG